MYLTGYQVVSQVTRRFCVFSSVITALALHSLAVWIVSFLLKTLFSDLHVYCLLYIRVIFPKIILDHLRWEFALIAQRHLDPTKLHPSVKN